jgi:hypothetical protein
MIVLAMLARAKGGEGVKSGPIGLAVILVLCVAAYFLFKSMSKHLKRVRDDFPTDPAAAPSDGQAPQAAAPPTEDEPATPDDSDQPTEAPPRSDAAP